MTRVTLGGDSKVLGRELAYAVTIPSVCVHKRNAYLCARVRCVSTFGTEGEQE